MCGTACPVQINTGDLVLAAPRTTRLAGRVGASGPALGHHQQGERRADRRVAIPGAGPRLRRPARCRRRRHRAVQRISARRPADAGLPRRTDACTRWRVSTRCSARPATVAAQCRKAASWLSHPPNPGRPDALCCGTVVVEGHGDGYQTMKWRSETSPRPVAANCRQCATRRVGGSGRCCAKARRKCE